MKNRFKIYKVIICFLLSLGMILGYMPAVYADESNGDITVYASELVGKTELRNEVYGSETTLIMDCDLTLSYIWVSYLTIKSDGIEEHQLRVSEQINLVGNYNQCSNTNVTTNGIYNGSDWASDEDFKDYFRSDPHNTISGTLNVHYISLPNITINQEATVNAVYIYSSCINNYGVLNILPTQGYYGNQFGEIERKINIYGGYVSIYLDKPFECEEINLGDGVGIIFPQNGMIIENEDGQLVSNPDGSTPDYVVIGDDSYGLDYGITDDGFQYRVNSNNTVEITRYIGDSPNVDIPRTINGYAVTGIIGAFINNTIISRVSIPNGVTYIGRASFLGCSNLSEVVLPDSILTIGEGALSGCESLTQINIPNSVLNLEDYAFYGCSELSEISIPYGVTNIPDGAFYYCNSLREINIPDGVTSIGNYAFPYCSMETLSIPNSVTHIGSSAFIYCSKLKEFSIPDGFLTIEERTFAGCSSLEKIVIPDSVTYIGYGAFTGCRSLTDITIPDGVTTIPDSAFSGCSSLKEIVIPDGVTSIGHGAFYNCTGLMDAYIPSSVTSFAISHYPSGYSYVFDLCENLTIWSFKDSSAEQYATDHSVPFIPLQIPEFENTEGDSFVAGQSYTINAFVYIGINQTDDCDGFSIKSNVADGTTITNEGVLTISENETSDEIVICAEYQGNETEKTIKLCRHNWGNGEVINEPTCTDKGTKKYTCSICGSTKTEDIDALGHVEVTKSAVDATCTETGLTEGKYCSVCNVVITEQQVVPALGHDEEDVDAKSATCTENGCKAGKKCSRCKEIISGCEVIQATGHTEETIPATPATCTSTGLTAGKKCTVCNTVTVEQQVVPTIDHDWDDGNVTKTATCSETGVKTFTCKTCGTTKTETIAKLAHTPVDDAAVAATCTTAGKTAGSHCSVCNCVITAQQTVNATGHSWDNGKVTKGATCTQNGIRTYTCTKCGTTKTESIPSKGHIEVKDAAVAATTTSTGLTEGSHCSVCGLVIVEQTVTPKLEEDEQDNDDKGDSSDPSDDKGDGGSKNISGGSSNGGSGGSSSGGSSGGSSGSPKKYSSEWVDGKWYNADGTQTYGYTLSWKSNGSGWWVEDSSGWYPTSSWQKINGVWYYFKADGYMAAKEWIDGWWLNDDGSCTYGGVGSWGYGSGGWWYGDSTGWYASNCWQKIDGYWYYFKTDGYMATNQYVDGYWIGANGICY